MLNNNIPLWAEDDIARAAQMLRDGFSAGQMAPHFGLTRNAVIGRVRRNKMLLAIGFDKSNGSGLNAERDGRKGGRKAAKAKRVPRTTKIKQSSRFPGVLAAPKVNPSPIPKPVVVRRAPVPTRIVCREITLLELQHDDCRWPTNTPERGEMFRFCGLPADEGRSYCPHHFRRSIGSGTTSERQASIDLEKAAA